MKLLDTIIIIVILAVMFALQNKCNKLETRIRNIEQIQNL